MTNMKIIKECQETISKVSHSFKIIAQFGSKKRLCLHTYTVCMLKHKLKYFFNSLSIWDSQKEKIKLKKIANCHFIFISILKI